MTVNIKSLRVKMFESGLSMERLAKEMGIDRGTLYRRFQNGGAKLQMQDVFFLCERLNLSTEEIMRIFFAK